MHPINQSECNIFDQNLSIFNLNSVNWFKLFLLVCLHYDTSRYVLQMNWIQTQKNLFVYMGLSQIIFKILQICCSIVTNLNASFRQAKKMHFISSLNLSTYLFIQLKLMVRMQCENSKIEEENLVFWIFIKKYAKGKLQSLFWHSTSTAFEPATPYMRSRSLAHSGRGLQYQLGFTLFWCWIATPVLQQFIMVFQI